MKIKIAPRVLVTITAASCVAALGISGCAPGGDDVAFGDQPIKLMAASSVGSAGDVFLRTLAEELEDEVSATVQVENVEGGGGEVALQKLKNSKPDGTALLLTTQSHNIGYATGEIKSVKPDDFDYISLLMEDPYVWVVDPDSEIDSVADLKSSDSKYSIGGSYPMSSQALASYAIADELGLNYDWVAFNGGPETLTAVQGGHIDIGMTTPGVARDYYKEESVRVLGVSTENEVDALPGAPTFKDQGVDYTGSIWRGLIAPKGVPDEIKEQMDNVLKKAFEGEKFQDLLDKQAADPKYTFGDEFKVYAEDDLKQMKEMAADYDK